MNLSVFAALIAAVALTSTTSANWTPPAQPAPPQPPPPQPVGAPPAPTPQPPPQPSGDLPKNEIYHFDKPTKVAIRGVAGCYVRPQCVKDFIKPPFSDQKYHKRLVVCTKPKDGKPKNNRYHWQVLPCTQEANKKRGFVRIRSLRQTEDDDEAPPLYLCLTKGGHKWPKGGFPVHFAVLKEKQHKGCVWQIRKTKAFCPQKKEFLDRHVLINKDYGRFMLRKRRKCDPLRPLFAIQSYQCEARIDRFGSFVIEPRKKQ